MSLITSVVFDLGNVLIDWDPRYLYRKLIPTETEVEWFLENICDEKWNAKHDMQAILFQTVLPNILKNSHNTLS